MKSLTLSTLALLALALAPALSQADNHRPDIDSHRPDVRPGADNPRPGLEDRRADARPGVADRRYDADTVAAERQYGERGYEQREQHMDMMRKRADAVHSARTELMERTDLCLDRATTPVEAKACIRAEREGTHAVHDRMKAQIDARRAARAEKRGERPGEPNAGPRNQRM